MQPAIDVLVHERDEASIAAIAEHQIEIRKYLPAEEDERSGDIESNRKYKLPRRIAVRSSIFSDIIAEGADTSGHFPFEIVRDKCGTSECGTSDYRFPATECNDGHRAVVPKCEILPHIVNMLENWEKGRSWGQS